MPTLPYRPTHTGSARVQATQASRPTTTRPPTHERHKGAAVALEPAPVASSDRLVRRARRPLILADGACALALRQEGAGAIEVLVKKPSGHQGWRKMESVLAPCQLRAWLRDGFG